MIEKIFNTAEVYNLKDMVDYADGSTVSKIITRNEKGNLTLFAFDKGQNLSEHSAPFDAIVQVLEGAGTIIINKKEHAVTEGQLIIMPANIPHAVEANEKFKMLLIMIKAS
ncbi:cupin domain-containing protein [Plebeiibacterium sediminum]|uniref:Cupin domain-containing protein n=1 Tax=Plebeiibacterium sediminum TaxID=2992112 RepID=A0AAE3M9H8_9BACT|nr:cupin domain-containing protein [Plebeiobacterium sediminum]MCW3789309.1 cupin domain-containing protein [Plebeiobacterium sediminum]